MFFHYMFRSSKNIWHIAEELNGPGELVKPLCSYRGIAIRDEKTDLIFIGKPETGRVCKKCLKRYRLAIQMARSNLAEFEQGAK